MKIAIFTDCFLPSINGVVTSIVNSSGRLARRGHEILIITSYPKDKKHEQAHLGKNIKVEYFKPMNLLKYPDFDLTWPDPRIFSRIMKFKPDIIHSHMPSFLGWQAILCSKAMNLPMVGSYHTLLPDFVEHMPFPDRFNKSRFMKNFTWAYTRRYYNLCDIVITPSGAMRKELMKHGIKPVRMLSNGVDDSRFHPIDAKKEGKNILYVGRVSYEKSINVVIRAFKIALKAVPEAKLTIVGGGPEMKKLKKEAGSQLNKSIIFTGPIGHDGLARVYSKADIFATASTIETEGLVILEAMACGLPIIGVDMLAVPDIVKHNINGFIASPGDEKEIARHMVTLLKDDLLRERFGKESLRIVKRFLLDSIIDRLEKIYSSLN